MTASRPVIFEDVAENWAAIRNWNTSYLTRMAGDTVVKCYISADGDFEKVRDETEPEVWVPASLNLSRLLTDGLFCRLSAL